MSFRSRHFTAVAIAAFSLSNFTATAQANWPAVTQQAKPWARWWWEGSAVNPKDLAYNLQSYQKAGLGGLEITPIYGVRGHEKEFIPFLSPKWIDMLQYTLQEARRLNLGIDLANATGWPFGGPWVTDADASKELIWKTYEVKGGEKLAEKVGFVQQPLVRSEAGRRNISEIKQPVSSNTNLQELAIDQVRFEKQLPLTALMAYNDAGEAINLTAKLGSNGQLDWTAPGGSNWRLYALFQGDHGKMVERAAPGGEGLVIDHFSKPALTHYLARFDEAFKGGKVSGIRSFFNDSYEVDDAQGQGNFTPHLFDEFARRRGYDLRTQLPALFGKTTPELNSRVLYDYRETISELLLDNFTKPWHEWGKSKGALIRNQSHGSPSNILDLYAAIDIPETEGNDILRFKFATSAAHVSGKPLASSESATWLHDHFLSSLGDVKQAIDQFFVGGVNHVFYHGVNYSPKDAAWPGWLFYAAVHFQQTNPFWQHFPALNHYIARCQSFLQQGKPSSDVLIYYPLADSFSQINGTALLKHYDALKPDFNGTGFATAAQQMLAKGYAFDFISDKQIIALQQNGSQLLTGGISYQTILLPDCRYIPLNTLQKIIGLVRGGATVMVYKNMPADVPGYGTLAQRQKDFKALIASLQFTPGNNGIQTARLGKGKVVMADDVNTLLNAAGVKRETMTDEGLQFVRRSNASGYSYFISNPGTKAVQAWVPLTVKARSATIFNPMLVQSGLAHLREVAGGATSVYLQLQPGESCIVQTSAQAMQGKAYAYYQPEGKAVPLDGSWTIRFTEGGPTLPPVICTNKLVSWTDLGNAETKTFSGIAAYTTTFAKPQGKPAIWQLNLGKVYESADVYLNGTKLGTLLGPDYSINIPATAFKTTNRLEVRVANLMANRIIDMDQKKIPYKIFYNTNFQAHDKANLGADGLFTAANWSPKPSGIVGVVTLTPLVLINVK